MALLAVAAGFVVQKGGRDGDGLDMSRMRDGLLRPAEVLPSLRVEEGEALDGDRRKRNLHLYFLWASSPTAVPWREAVHGAQTLHMSSLFWFGTGVSNQLRAGVSHLPRLRWQWHRVVFDGNATVDFGSAEALGDVPICSCPQNLPAVAPAAAPAALPDVSGEGLPATSGPRDYLEGQDDDGTSEGGEIADDWTTLICSFNWPCPWAITTALCESGPDLSAPFDGYHVGAFQIASLHAWRFTARGWDYWQDGDDLYRNSAVAYEIWAEQGATPWPWCGQ